MLFLFRTILVGLGLSVYWTSVVAGNPPKIRVMTYNIHAGRGTDGQLNLVRIAATIRRGKPDLVALQEVDRGTGRGGGRDHLKELGELTQMQVAFGKAIDHDGGSYGVGVLSKYPIGGSKTFKLPGSEGREKRVALEVRIQVPQMPPLIFVSTHFDHTADSTDRIRQADHVLGLFAQGPSLAIVAGDLNATIDSQPLRILAKHWRPVDKELRPTIPALTPRKKIDFLLVGKEKPWRASEVEVLVDPVSSDHLPLVAELTFGLGD